MLWGGKASPAPCNTPVMNQHTQMGVIDKSYYRLMHYSPGVKTEKKNFPVRTG